VSEESAVNPMRCCGAKTRAGHPCRSRSMPNGRCRMHGGTNPGAPKGNRNSWKHGLRSNELRLHRALLRQMAAAIGQSVA